MYVYAYLCAHILCCCFLFVGIVCYYQPKRCHIASSRCQALLVAAGSGHFIVLPYRTL